jgi:arabinose-5-phosphate isomerase
MATGGLVPLVSEEALMSDALMEMSGKGYGVAGTVNADGMLTGIITDGDLRRNMEGLLDRRAKDVATAEPQTIRPDQLAQEALAIMNERKITCLFVTGSDDARPLGILHVHDCLRAGVDEG